MGSWDIEGGVSGEAGLSGFSWSRIRTRGLWGRVGSGGCVIVAEFSMEGLHFFHANVVGGTQLQLVHRGRCIKVDVVGEGVELKGKGHALENHFLVEVWGAKGSLAEAVDECPECLTLFLLDAEEGDCSSLMWAAASKMGCKHV